MAVKWIKTKWIGVRYRHHKTRKHGVGFDRCFSIRYKVKKKDKEEVVGWSSEGVTAENAFKLLTEIRENIRSGLGPHSLAELRKLKKVEAQQARNDLATNHEYTIEKFWKQFYWPMAQATKTMHTLRCEESVFKKWVNPSLGIIPLASLTTAKIEALSLHVINKKKSPKTVNNIIALVSQIWAMAHSHNLVKGENPCRRVKKPRQDSKRTRFLTENEATLLLQELAKRSKDVHDSALLALFAGLRAGEIHGLTWGDINFNAGTICIRDPKNKKTRFAFITPEIGSMLNKRHPDQESSPGQSSLIFPSQYGRQRISISKTFVKAVEDLGFNDGVSDIRERVVFHTLRHTFASWLVQKGTPLYTVGELLGHSSIEMTKRYSHLAPDTMRQAALSLTGILNTNT